MDGKHRYYHKIDHVLKVACDDDPILSNTTTVRILKNRYTGDTGLACSLKYNSETGRLYEITNEETFDNEDDIPF